MSKEKKKPLPFWLQIVCILLVGVIASGTSFLVIQNVKQEKHVVTFAYQDGTIIKEKKVANEKGVVPPKISSDGVFRGWSTAINNVTEDIETHPNIYNIVEENLFYFDSQYVKEGKNVTIDIFVGGEVNFSTGELLIDYDNEVLEYKKEKSSDFVTVSKEKDGQLKLTFDSENPITEKQLLSSVTFKTKKLDVYSTELLLQADKVKYVDENGKEQPATFATINNKIFFLQEVM